MKRESDTPRTDAFLRELKPVRLPVENFEVMYDVRELMIAWSQFARDLERELNASVPQEWEPTLDKE